MFTKEFINLSEYKELGTSGAFIYYIVLQSPTSPYLTIDQATIASQCNMTPRTLQTALKRLVDLGFISVQKNFGEKTYTYWAVSENDFLNGVRGNK